MENYSLKEIRFWQIDEENCVLQGHTVSRASSSSTISTITSLKNDVMFATTSSAYPNAAYVMTTICLIYTLR